MLKFSEYKYEELNVEEISLQLNQLVEEFKNAKSGKKQVEALAKFNELNVRVNTAMSIASVRFSQNVNDKYYAQHLHERCRGGLPRPSL